MVIISSFISFFHNNVAFSGMSYSPISIRSPISFLMNIDFVIIDHISQLSKPISFSYLALLELEFDSFDMMEYEVFGGISDGSIS